MEDQNNVNLRYVENLPQYCEQGKRRKIKMVAFDLDSTLIRCNHSNHYYSWETIYETLGIPDEVRSERMKAYLDLTHPKSENYKQWCDDCCEYFISGTHSEKGLVLNQNIMEQIYEKFNLAPGVKELIEELWRKKVKMIVVSGGVGNIGRRVLGDLWNYFDDYFINKFFFDETADRLDRIEPTLYDFEGKERAIERMSLMWDFDIKHEVAFVGNATNDKRALRCTGLGIHVNSSPSEDSQLVDSQVIEVIEKILTIIDDYERGT